MSVCKVVQVVCLMASVSVVMPQDYNYFSVNYPDSSYNDINEDEQSQTDAPTDSPSDPCTVTEFTKWDKLFTMLENSQMNENMLLQYSDQLVKIGMKSLRTEVRELVAQTRSSCAAVVDSSVRLAGVHTEMKLQQALEKLNNDTMQQQKKQNETVQQILQVILEQAKQLNKVETCCLDGRLKSISTRHLDQEDRNTKEKDWLHKSLQTIMDELQSLREQLELYNSATVGHVWPAGCEMALFFPMRTPKMLAEIIPHHSMQTRAFTICLWVKPTQVLNNTVLFSYGTTANPLELQLLLSGNSVLFTVGGEAHLVVARNAVKEGRWVHLCGTWSSEQGLASLWVNGQMLASSPGVAEGHELPADGEAILGQDYGGKYLAKRFGIQDAFKVEEAFTGKMSGVNAWNRILSKDEIFEQARLNGSSCGAQGNLMAWGVSQIVEKGGVTFIY